jgi:hypothetical protein
VAWRNEVPPLFFPDWKSCSLELRRQLYAYALVRRVFDSLWFPHFDLFVQSISA